MGKQCMLTTTDNPFDPFDDWDNWWAYDFHHGYHTPGFLARIVVTSDELSLPDQHAAIEAAIDEIVEENVTGLYEKVERDFVEVDEPVVTML